MPKVPIAHLLVISGLLAGLFTACSTLEPVSITIELDEFSFSPEHIELRVGQQVTITLVNVGELDHEFMVGRNLDFSGAIFPHGYQDDFFAVAGIVPEVSGGGMLMNHNHPRVMVMGDGMQMPMETATSSAEFSNPLTERQEAYETEVAATTRINMVMHPAGSEPTLIEFTVTSAMLGEWEIGCFLLDAAHYSNGMRGTITVTR